MARVGDDFERWLDSLGLGGHAEGFAAQGLGFDTLPWRTDAQLAALGLAPAELRLLRSALHYRASIIEASAPPQAQRGERRQITVMFCDLVDWTAWANRLDPEDLTRLTAAYYTRCCRRIEQFGGFSARLEGDGILAYFGYPAAREDAVECAIRAGLDIVDVMGREGLDGRYRVDVRIGLATGLAVVGDMVGDGFAESSVVMGLTPNLAKRVQSLAEPGTVAVSDDTRRLAGGLFEYADAGLHQLKGFDDPLRLWRVLGVSMSDVRFDAGRGASHACVGREPDVAQLQAAWEGACRGACHAVAVVGEAGIGKSRLLRAASECFDPLPARSALWQCSPSQSSTPMYPVVAWLRRETGVSRSVAADNRRRLEDWLAGNPMDAAVPLLAQFLSVPLADGEALPQMPADLRRDLTRELVASQLERLATAGPLLLMVEDVHWMDGATQGFLDLLLARLRGRPFLALLTTRPTQLRAWDAAESMHEIRLAALPRPDAERLVQQVCGERALPQAVLHGILARADGIPLFLEELTAAVLESGLLQAQGGALVQAGALASPDIPSTLQDSLLARLDHLGDAKDVARVGSVIGREFGFALLAQVMAQPHERIELALERLVQAQLLFRRGTPSDVEYVFKHALVQQAAYDGQLRSDRQAWHARIVAMVELHQPELARHEPELLAYHCQRAGLADREVDYLYAAGVASTRMVAIPEALAAFRAAEAALLQLPESPRNHMRHIDILVGMMEVGRFAILPRQLVELSARARALSLRYGVACDAETLAAILFQDGRARLYVSRYAEARRIFREVRALGTVQDAERIERKPASAFAMALCCQGLFGEMLEFIDDGNIGYYQASGSAIDYISGLGWLGYASCEAGAGDGGVRFGDLSVQEAERLQSPIYVGGARIWRSHALMAVRRLDEAVADAQRSYELGASMGIPYLRWHALVFLSLCLCRSGRLQEAGASLARARVLLEQEAQGQWSLLDYLPAIEAEIACFSGEHARAIALADQAIALAASLGGHFAEAIAWRAKAVSLVRSGGDAEGAQTCFSRAQALHAQGRAHAEAAFSALVWAHALADAGHGERARTWVASARALAAQHGLVLERCEHGAAGLLTLHP